ncbi:hypothetical protein B5807_10881 [Epicoccum nigrum]|uniref:Uncharacterized protein n=1 Tax=Epicoccum nigrum TaxID=105696 RepID=A0A1Y2LKT2_EPING|nr:hypothetical protein B5807_10881 [Epicoccum nigrum]
MPAQKRTRNGVPKPTTLAQTQPQDISMVVDTPPCGQAQPPAPGKILSTEPKAEADSRSKNPRKKGASKKTSHPQSGSKTANKPTYEPTKNRHTKRPALPPHATFSKRPLLHPSIPTPFASSSSQKVLYITASSPFIPACKRIRALLSQIASREAQSAAALSSQNRRGRGRGSALEVNGRLEPRDVEAGIADAAAAVAGRGKGQGKGSVGSSEMVRLKATGRAIPRALELGLKFQGEADCVVRVETGSVRAVDDVEVREGEGGGGVDGEEEEVPETRIRTLSTVTVCIGLR